MTAQGIPDIRKEVLVTCSPEHAFATFTERIGAWWPLDRHSVAAEILGVEPQGISFVPGPEGRIVEALPDGDEVPWAHVRAWEPPLRLLLAWKPNPGAVESTEIEIRFVPEGERTRVRLEHRGFATLAKREEYAGGWAGVLACFAALADL
jgi:uncharacterized protein YndB with AHSA1/START domain